ncbi:MAG: helix-turn-helix domain-containing protein [Aeromicrobium sp.]
MSGTVGFWRKFRLPIRPNREPAMTDSDTPESTPVTDGALVRARRERLGASQSDVADEAGVNRDTVSAVEHGNARAKSRRIVEDALTRMEEEAGLPPFGQPLVERVAPIEGSPALMRVEVPNLHGGKALVVEGPVDNPEALAAMVDALMRRLYPEG